MNLNVELTALQQTRVTVRHAIHGKQGGIEWQETMPLQVYEYVHDSRAERSRVDNSEGGRAIRRLEATGYA